MPPFFFSFLPPLFLDSVCLQTFVLPLLTISSKPLSTWTHCCLCVGAHLQLKREKVPFRKLSSSWSRSSQHFHQPLIGNSAYQRLLIQRARGRSSREEGCLCFKTFSWWTCLDYHKYKNSIGGVRANKNKETGSVLTQAVMLECFWLWKTANFHIKVTVAVKPEGITHQKHKRLREISFGAQSAASFPPQRYLQGD